MKTLKVAAAAVLLGTFSFGAMAAQEITRDQAKEYEKIGVINTTGEVSSPMDAKAELSRLADEKGGKYFVVIAADEANRVNATADVYK
ncbi:MULTISPECIES: YdgH/BhsA/McbA-like domain containing protein [Rahnella]|uniref:YdgH/BhsA/McbA-like domain containing protein n=1 Tax=Rahnella TaxID=34037 RepID=UPI000BB1A75D|nr:MULTISPECIES: YdgH/BhsA/McbA-like domain containing protein [Rahnella]PKB89643.1 hypothetical protein A8A01_13050 [Ewingella americana]VTQ57775.1 Protein of uncharacterised function (DUF1471) [Campylobacter jejuni]PBI80426.1 hypothetical protein A9993_12105 [Rahnella victoriana]TBX30740.1 DUF1471 domain-containing protein [Rahnella victoriana]TDS88878.1 uncharacterized protein DUF1471 [Rahnella sp. BIGb0236]